MQELLSSDRMRAYNINQVAAERPSLFLHPSFDFCLVAIRNTLLRCRPSTVDATNGGNDQEQEQDKRQRVAASRGAESHRNYVPALRFAWSGCPACSTMKEPALCSTSPWSHSIAIVMVSR